MNRAQRKAHALIWPLLALVMLATIGAALIARPRAGDIAAAHHEGAG